MNEAVELQKYSVIQLTVSHTKMYFIIISPIFVRDKIPTYASAKKNSPLQRPKSIGLASRNIATILWY